MQLATARLCLDCDEVHDLQVCPVCASETFTFLSRWVPSPQPGRQRAAQKTSPEAEIYRTLIDEGTSSGRGRLLKQGLIGLTAVGVFGWLWRNSNASARARADERRDSVDREAPGA